MPRKHMTRGQIANVLRHAADLVIVNDFAPQPITDAVASLTGHGKSEAWAGYDAVCAAVVSVMGDDDCVHSGNGDRSLAMLEAAARLEGW